MEGEVIPAVDCGSKSGCLRLGSRRCGVNENFKVLRLSPRCAGGGEGGTYTELM